MFIPLIFSMTMLVGLHYFNKAELVYEFMVKQPLQYYIWFILLLIAIQTCIFIYKNIYPHIKGFYRSISRITSRIDNLSNTIDKSSNSDPNSPFKNGQKRNMSSKVRSTNLITPSPKGKVNTLSGLKNKLDKVLSSRRIKGLFASIVENGAMVSLEATFRPDPEFGVKLSKLQAEEAVLQLSKRGKVSRLSPNHDGTYRVLSMVQGSVSDLILGLGWRVISACFPNKVKFISRMRLLKMFYGYIFRMYKCHGSTQVVKFLKASQLALQKAIGGDKVDNLRVLDKSLVRSGLTSSGLPTIIPSRDRKLIMGGSQSIIRFWLTLFSVYRVIKIPGDLKLATIVAPLEAAQDHEEVVRQFYTFLRVSSAKSMFSLSRLFREADLLLLESASSSHPVAWTGLMTNPGLLDSLGLGIYARNLMSLMKQTRLRLLFDGFSAFAPYSGARPHLGDVLADPESQYSHSVIASPRGAYAGKLSIKEEAAGKLRVFAMVDVWSQTILKPIEQMLAIFLKGLPNDGTYDQHASELRARDKSIKAGFSFGYDLSSATDRLPLKLQSFILDLIIPQLGENWAIFLTKRDYLLYLPTDFSKSIGADSRTMRAKAPNSFDVGTVELPVYYDSDKVRPWTLLRYSVGQPMGALSSFAMLAVCHHFIVQFAFRLAYPEKLLLPLNKENWFDGYECTGDDVIIFDRLVAEKYLSLMASFGVPINTTKSVIASKAVTEYLKVTSLNGSNVGALSWKMFMSGNSLMGRANILNAILSKGVIKTHINRYIASVSRLAPYSNINLLTPTLIALWSMLANRNIISAEECLKALISGKDKVFKLARAILMNADVNKITLALPKIYKDGTVNLVTSKVTETIWSFEHPWFKITMWKPLAVFQAKADIAKDTDTLALKMFKMILPAEVELPEDFLELASSNILNYGEPVVPEVANISDQEIQLNDLVILFTYFRNYIFGKLDRIGTPLLVERGQIDSPLPLLVEQNKELDRYNEVLLLVDRAESKLDPDFETPPARNIRPTELSMIKLLRKMGNRPLFTTASSLFK